MFERKKLSTAATATIATGRGIQDLNGDWPAWAGQPEMQLENCVSGRVSARPNFG
jgi:hypothetical protein